MIQLKLIALILLSTFASTEQVQPPASVEGRVVDEDNMSVANVRVYALPEQGVLIGIQPSAKTDEAGMFVLSGLPPGPTRLFPVLAAQGYPDGRNGIFAGDPSLYKVVNLEAGKTVRDLVITMPKKGATLVLNIVDAETNQPVLTSRIHITRPDLEGAYYDSSPRFHGPFELVLPKLPFRVEVRAPGYQTWQYSGIDSNGKESLDLVLEPGTRKTITVSLKKVSQSPETSQKQ